MAFAALEIIGPTSETSYPHDMPSQLNDITRVTRSANEDLHICISYKKERFPFLDEMVFILVECKFNPIENRKLSDQFVREEVDFRPLVWQTELFHHYSDLESICPLKSCHSEKDSRCLPDPDGFVRFELTLHKERIKRSFLTIDYEGFVMDGGWYYTVNLPAYALQACNQDGRSV